jgi:selenide, water dikinase
MAGAIDTIDEAGAHLVGGHSIEDDTLKLGFSVTGLGAPGPPVAQLRRRDRATCWCSPRRSAPAPSPGRAEERRDRRRGDGAGDRLDAPGQPPRPPDALHAAVHAATDVTGFGVLGHALHVAQGSGATLGSTPPRCRCCRGRRDAARGILTKAHGNDPLRGAARRGREALDEVAWWSLVDPQTSGGLLLSVDAAQESP